MIPHQYSIIVNGAGARQWRACLASAFRTAFACTIVGCTTLFGPAFLQRQIAFPAFSYVTVILIIVADATLGDALRGCWLALYATVQSIGPAIFCLWMIGPARLSSLTTALAVALGAFVVALPESTHLVAKRIALGQIVIVYVVAFINGEQTQPVMHPVHLAASTALGVLACVLSSLLPYPRLACYQVKQNCKLLSENASERLKLFVRAFCAENSTSALASISQTKSLDGTGTKLLSSIKRHQGSMQWEGLSVKGFELGWHVIKAGDRLQDLVIPFKGMEMALTSISSYPVEILLDGELKDHGLLRLEELLSLLIKQAECFLPYNHPLTVPEYSAEEIMKSLQTLQTIPTAQEDLPPYFFIFCMKFLHSKLLTKPSDSKRNNPVQKNENSTDPCQINVFSLKGVWSNWPMKVSSERLMAAFKCSLSLGLAVLFGLLYSKENGYWSGLPVAITLASAREATFTVANVKAQGTVLGTVYGVLVCSLFGRFLSLRLLFLLPWFVFASFLQRSQMYGQAGGISAVIGAVMILGRNNYGPPSQFAIARITETFIGLSCSIMVELILQPARASTLAKAQLSKSLGLLHECVTSVSILNEESKSKLEGNQKRLKIQVSELGKVFAEAEVEPNFWFLPFHSASYSKILKSLSKMEDLLLFSAHAISFLQVDQSQGVLDQDSWKEFVDKIEDDLKLIKEIIGSSIKCFEQVILMKSLTLLEKELAQNKVCCDLELGKSRNPNIILDTSLHEHHDIEKIIDSYLQHSKDQLDKILHVHESDQYEVLKCHKVLSLTALGFCISSLVRETAEMEKKIIELVRWENPSSHIDMYELSCQLRALYK
ncbi:hypothetical protein CIPAW_14G070500 [Carya illinoinensis]|uniref:Integral membrane bound transporter domain-containing protein n=2 Tax=Carya illinoinensis TaxID=32201 RepID=A0A8T1NBU9_CARIL|nr:hypothetical protein CIPAW_14G070500 [Carya illinoinensis]